jgi:threonine/homoserine/homoserine lactone efflux protein
MNLSAGPANFYVMTRANYAGFAATAGLALASSLHVVAAVLGLSVLFSYSPVSYNLLKIVGASFLIYLGLKHFWNSISWFNRNVSNYSRR